MGDVEKPSGTAATEVMGEAWPPESESSYFAKAKQCLAMAAKEQKNAQTSTHAATYTDQEADGRAYNKLAEELHIKAHASTVNAEKWAALSGWAQHMGELIQSTKQTIVAEVKAHEAVCVTGKSLTSTADVMKESGDVSAHKTAVATAMTTLETELTAAETSCASDVIPAPPGGTPKIPDQDANLPDAPATDPTATPSGGVTGGAGTGSPGASAPSGAGAPGGGAPAAQPLPPSAFAAPPAAATPPASAAPAGGTPAAAESPASGMPMSGMPMSGMPMSGMPQMPQMQPPQMPAGGQTPGGDLAKTVGDTVTKLAGKDGGTPVSEATLDKLLGAQGGEHDGKASNDPAKLPDSADDPLKKVFGNQPPAGSTAQTHALDPYTAANQNPSLNNPSSPIPSHLQSPSPAASVVTAAPAGPVSAPMTELSADENYSGPQQHPNIPSPSDAVTTHPSAGPAAPPASPAAPGAGTPAVPGGPQPAGSLGAYNPGALGAPAPMPMAPMGAMGAPMGGMMAPSAAGGGGAATPVLAAAVPASVVEAATSGRRRASEVTRVTSLPPEHATAERHLAGLLRVFTQKGWATAILAIACLEGQAGVRYLLATADGISLVPLGVPVPGGVELLSEQPLSPSFAADWSGHVHPARKLAAWSAEHPEAGRLVYLVSNDSAGVPAVSGAVVEMRQTQAERSELAGGSPATLPRTSLAAEMIPAPKAVAALHAFGHAWGITDATADDWRTAPGRLWISRWDRDRPDEYPAILATYWYIEGLEAVRQGRDADAAFSASALAAVRPYDWVAA